MLISALGKVFVSKEKKRGKKWGKTWEPQLKLDLICASPATNSSLLW